MLLYFRFFPLILLNWGARPTNRVPFRWKAVLRTAPYFAELWNVNEEDLIASMDRICFVPYERLKMTARNEFGWPHLDQSREGRRGPLKCVQGLVTFNPIGPGEVALVVYQNSHKHHARFFTERVEHDADRNKTSLKKDFCKLTEQDRAWYLAQPGVEEVRVHAPEGSLILWDSRTVHHALPPLDNTQRSMMDRYVLYSCMVPRAWAKPSAIAKRIQHFENGRSTPHWPHDGLSFPSKPRVYSKEDRETMIDPAFDPKTRQPLDAFFAAFQENPSECALLRRLIGYDA
jgi:hypothetical protein